jgi:hypothetical protein
MVQLIAVIPEGASAGAGHQDFLTVDHNAAHRKLSLGQRTFSQFQGFFHEMLIIHN